MIQKRAIHMVSAWASKAKAVFGQTKIATEEKSNEMAVPLLLELLDIKGTIITADAMSCQKRIVSKSQPEADAIQLD